MKNIVVTGGAGFIGSNFIRYLLKINNDVKVNNLDILTYAGHLESLEGLDTGRYEFVRGDINDRNFLEKLFFEKQIDTVVHFAAESHVDRSIQDPGQFVQTNILGTYNLLETARQYWAKNLADMPKRFHHVSTDEVFGMLNHGDAAFHEKTPYAPNSPYAASKASSDHLVRSYFHTFKLPVTISNCSNNYGPYQFPEKLIPLMILNAVKGLHLPVYGDGQQIRDWLYVEDHCQAIYMILTSGVIGETYNVGGNNQPPNIDIVKMICKILDEKLPSSPYIPHEKLIQFVQDRPGHDFRYDIDISKIRRELGWIPTHELEQGLIKTVEWYLSNSNWLNSVTGTDSFQDWISINYSKR